MKIEIKLKDPRICNGCPCLEANNYDATGDWCSQEFFDGRRADKVTRPQECIDKHGE